MYNISNFLLIFSVISNVHCAIVKREACSESTQLTPAQKQAALDAHNHHRSQAGGTGDAAAANMLKLVWSDRLASWAQNWANQCEIGGHSQCDASRTTGANQLLLSDTDKPTFNTTDITAVVQQWANEKENYNFSFNNCSGTCSHYTQLVWAWTAEVGCGLKRRPYVEQSGIRLHGLKWNFVCYYNPAGNTPGMKPYRQGTTCSKCDRVIRGTYWCDNNLCVSF